MTDEEIRNVLIRARSLIVHAERHLDIASDSGNLEDVGRAWVRAVQLERVLASVLPKEEVADIEAALHREEERDRPADVRARPSSAADAQAEQRSAP